MCFNSAKDKRDKILNKLQGVAFEKKTEGKFLFSIPSCSLLGSPALKSRKGKLDKAKESSSSKGSKSLKASGRGAYSLVSKKEEISPKLVVEAADDSEGDVEEPTPAEATRLAEEITPKAKKKRNKPFSPRLEGRSKEKKKNPIKSSEPERKLNVDLG